MVSVSELFGTEPSLIMYVLSDAEQHVRASLRDAILLLCQTGLKFNTELSVDGLLAVTLDKKHVFLLNIKETLQAVEQCRASDDSDCPCTTDSQAASNFTSVSLSGDIDDHVILNGGERDYARSLTGLRLPAEMPSPHAGDAIQLDTESLCKSDRTSRRRQRKQRRTVRRILDPPCPAASPPPASLESSEQSARVSGWSGDMPVYSDNERENGYCNSAGKTHLLYDDSDRLVTANLVEQNVAYHGDQTSDEADNSSLLVIEDPNRLIDPALPEENLISNGNLISDSDPMSERSHCKKKQYLDHSTCPVATSSATSLGSLIQIQHIPRSVDNQNGEAPIVSEVEEDRCKMELSDNFSDGIPTECQDLTAGRCQLANVKRETLEPALSSRELAPLGRNVQPSSSDPQQQMAVMSQFGLSAIVANMQSHFALMPKPFPWSVRTFPSLSSATSLPPAQCGMVGINSRYFGLFL